MIRRIILLFIICLLSPVVFAQQVSVSKMTETTDFIPGDDQRRDFNKELCALVKIQVVDDVTDVEGNVMGDIVTRGVEKWVYMARGSKKMKIHLKNHLPIDVVFQKYKITGLKSNRVYQLVLSTEGKGGKLSPAVEKYDRIEMKDMSYIQCKIVSAKAGYISFKQDGVDGVLKVAIKDVSRIKYASGAQKKY